MRTALIVGNGLTKSLLTHLQIPICSSTPFGWDLPSPISISSSLIEDFPDLKKYVSQSNELGIFDDFEILGHLVKNSSKSSLLSPVPSGDDFEQSAILDSAHFLALSYSWLQLEIDKYSMENWAWAKLYYPLKSREV